MTESVIYLVCLSSLSLLPYLKIHLPYSHQNDHSKMKITTIQALPKAIIHRIRIPWSQVHPQKNAHVWHIKPSMTWLKPISSSSFPISHFITLQPYWTTCQTSCCSLSQYKLMLLPWIRILTCSSRFRSRITFSGKPPEYIFPTH